MEAGLRLLFQAAQKEIVPPPAQNDIGDDLPDGIVILRLFSGEKGMMVQNELTDGLEILGEEGTGAQASKAARFTTRTCSMAVTCFLWGVVFIVPEVVQPEKANLPEGASARKGYRVSPFRGGRTKIKSRELMRSRKG